MLKSPSTPRRLPEDGEGSTEGLARGAGYIVSVNTRVGRDRTSATSSVFARFGSQLSTEQVIGPGQRRSDDSVLNQVDRGTTREPEWFRRGDGRRILNMFCREASWTDQPSRSYLGALPRAGYFFVGVFFLRAFSERVLTTCSAEETDADSSYKPSEPPGDS